MNSVFEMGNWTERQRLDFLEGWCFQRLGYPRVAGTERSRFYMWGLLEAARVEEDKANEPS